jgi:putative PIN family toxin of toxin-antitoxin system
MRITPDTGILVRMNAKATGPARRLLDVILAGPHELVLPEFLLNETRRVLHYPRMQDLYKLSNQDISEHIDLLRERSDLIDPIVYTPVVLADPNDDPVIYTAVAGRSDILCAMDRDFYAPAVVAFCGQRGIEIINDVELLKGAQAAGRGVKRMRNSEDLAAPGESVVREFLQRLR